MKRLDTLLPRFERVSGHRPGIAVLIGGDTSYEQSKVLDCVPARSSPARPDQPTIGGHPHVAGGSHRVPSDEAHPFIERRSHGGC